MKKFTLFIITIIILFSTFLSGCNDSEKITIYAPDGAPALALYSNIKNDLKDTEISIVSADKIASYISGENKKADICILPINMASKLIGDGNDYKMLGTITHGNFYFLSNSDVSVNKDNLSLLIGKTIGVLQLNNVPGLVLQSVLKSNNVEYEIIQDSTENKANKVNLMAINKVETSRTDIDVFLIPSPQADIKAQTTTLKFVGSLGDLYSENGFPQAIVAIKNTLINDNLAFVKEFLSNLKNVNDYLLEDNSYEICTLIQSRLEKGLTPIFNQNNLNRGSINNSKIQFVSAKDSKERVVAFINDLKSVQPSSVNEFSENFFYQGEI